MPDRDLSWKELEKITDYLPGHGAWMTNAMIELHKLGFDIVNIELWDIDKFLQNSKLYLLEHYGEEVGRYAIDHSNLVIECERYKTFKELNILQNRIPTFDDIRQLLDDGYLAASTLNSRALNGKTGYSGHFIVIIGYDKHGLIIHDPGLPPQPNRHVDYELFGRAWSIPTEATRILYAFRK